MMIILNEFLPLILSKNAPKIILHNMVRLLWYLLKYRMPFKRLLQTFGLSNVNQFGSFLLPLSLYKVINNGVLLFDVGKEEMQSYESLVAKTLSLLQKGDVFVDIGAYMGTYTLLGSQYVGKLGKVISIEPHPETFQILMKNVSGLENVQCYQVALSDSEGKATFFLNSHAASSSLIGGKFGQNDDAVCVDVKTLDSLLLGHSHVHVSMLKLDVEEAEFMVLKGAKYTLINSEPNLVIEVHRDSLSLWPWLEWLGYEIMPLSFTHIFARKKKQGRTVYFNARN